LAQLLGQRGVFLTWPGLSLRRESDSNSLNRTELAWRRRRRYSHSDATLYLFHRESLRIYDAFGLIGTTFRELDWKTLIFFEAAVPISLNDWYAGRCQDDFNVQG
jgi:hypothetical protein